MISVLGENHIIGKTKATSDAEKLSYLGWVVVWAWGRGGCGYAILCNRSKFGTNIF